MKHPSSRDTPGFSAGAGRAQILLLDPLFPMDGFTGVHDPVHVRVALLDDSRRQIAIVVVEMTSLAEESVDELRGIVADAAAMDVSQIIVSASHTFSVPHLVPRSSQGTADEPKNSMLADTLADATRAAAVAAVEARRPARVRAGRGYSRVAVNRDVETEGGWWLGADDGGTSDPEVEVVRIEDLEGRPIAVLFNYGVQSSVMNESFEDDGSRLVTADLAGAAARHIERQYADDVVALFIIGAAGDQAPYLSSNRYSLDAQRRLSRRDGGSSGHLLVELLGERLGAAVVRIIENGCDEGSDTVSVSCTAHEVTVPAQIAPASFRDLAPTRDYQFGSDGNRPVPFWILVLGEIRVIGLQAELSASSGILIKQRFPAVHTLVATMVNGAAKYLPDASAYQRMTYEAMSARYAAGAAEFVAGRIIEALASSLSDHPETQPAEPVSLGRHE